MRYIIFFMILTSLSFATEESQQIDIVLSTENQLMPIYLAKIVDAHSGFSANYLNSIEEVLSFDLNYNGMTRTISQNPQNEKLANSLAVERKGNASHWKPSIYYIIKATVSNRKLSASVFPIDGGEEMRLEGLNLTGEIHKDRSLLHQLSDAIYKTLFGEEGIASSRILFSIKKPNGKDKWSAEIWEADYDGSNAKPIIRDGHYNITPVYVPAKEGHRSGSFFYVSYHGAQPKIFVATIKEGIGRRLTSLTGNQLMPAIARTRDKVAFINDITGHPDLFVQSFSPEEGAKGKPQQIFSAKNASQGSPTFSPDGKLIAFVTNKDGSPKIYVMDVPLQGTALKDIHPRLITRHCSESSAPCWSPDGTKIAYCAKTGGHRQIWIYDFSTGEERQLTDGSGNKENPSWSANSLCLVYNSSDRGNCELYLTTIHNPQPVKITSGAFEKRFPNWQ